MSTDLQELLRFGCDYEGTQDPCTIENSCQFCILFAEIERLRAEVDTWKKSFRGLWNHVYPQGIDYES